MPILKNNILRNKSFREKIILIVMFNTGVALLLVSAIFMTNEFITYRYTLAQELSNVGRLVAKNVRTAMDRGDKNAAESALNSLTHYPDITSAVIYADDGSVFAHYPEELNTGLGLLMPGKYLTKRQIHAYDEIQYQRGRIGTVYLQSGLQKLYDRLFVFIRILIVVILCTFLVALQISKGMHRVISGPILYLTNFSKRVSKFKNYSIRAERRTDDEVGDLTNTINSMLSTVETTQRKLHHGAFHDSLTGLPNRALLYDRIERLIQYGRRNPDYKFALIFLDLDRFKLINDSLGHVQGDELLKQFSGRLIHGLRKLDTVSRLGGDEFVILMGEIKQAQDAIIVANRIKAILKEPFNLGGQEVFVTTSIGIAYNDKDYLQPTDFLRDADNAMYNAKSLGKSCYQIFNKKMHDQMMEALKSETDLRNAIRANEFVLHYQPIYTIKDRKIDSLEALLRWNHPERGMVFPDEFIPLAEEIGLIVDIGEIVFDMVCHQVRAWQKKKIGTVKTSINFSTKQFEQGGLLQYLKEKTSETRVDPGTLIIEITESTAIHDLERCSRLMGEIKDIGIRFSLDDFGTGFFSLNCLNILPVDFLKIDRTLVASIGKDKNSESIIKAIIAMSHDLGFRVIAEGVETESQLAMLSKYGCDQAQGYLFSKPVPVGEIEKIL